MIEIGGRRCWPVWRGVHDLEAVLTCFHRRPAGARGADYCAGKPTPTADATTWGCRFVRGVDLEAWGHDRVPWYHFGQLTDEGPSRPVGITRTDPDRDLAVSVRVPLEGEDEDAAVPRHVPTVRYADVAGQAAAVQAVRDVCDLPLTHGAYFAALGLAPPRGVILYGPARQWQDVTGTGGGDRNRGAPGDHQRARDPFPVGGGQ